MKDPKVQTHTFGIFPKLKCIHLYLFVFWLVVGGRGDRVCYFWYCPTLQQKWVQTPTWAFNDKIDSGPLLAEISDFS